MRRPLVLLAALLLAALLLLGGAYFGLRATLAPLPGEWAVPVVLGPLTLQAGVPSMLRLATSGWAGPLLHGHRMQTRHGVLEFSWAGEGLLEVRCAPCLLQPPGLGDEPLRLPEARVTVRRIGDSLQGRFAAGRVQGEWKGRFSAGGLRLHIEVPMTPLADAYALFAENIPELARARIAGSFSLQAQLVLPNGSLVLQPRLEGFAVSGLGTEALLGARSECSVHPGQAGVDSWLARAVIAAEDQRFHEHPGYDLAEVAAALARNQQAQRIARGGSTLSQQVAKLLVTGDARTPVRKLRELLYAVEMEQTLGKARILRLYLDNVPWGEGVCGAEAAARHYFGVRARELTILQASWLAAMLHNPDAEAQRWSASGRIDIERTQWVLMNLRGLSYARKLQLNHAVEGVDWAPPGRPGRP